MTRSASLYLTARRLGGACLALLGAASPARGDVPSAPEPAPLSADDLARRDQAARVDAWSGVSFGWDLHAEAVALFKHYTIEERGAWYSGQGGGGGATASLHFRPPGALARGVLRWVEFELGLGNSTHFVRWEEGGQARPRTEFIENQTYGILGVHVGSGRWPEGDAAWSGAVVGLAWVPTYVHFFANDEFGSGGQFHHGGVRLSVDWGRVSPANKGLVPGLRAFLTWLPYIGSLPTSVSAGVGCVFF